IGFIGRLHEQKGIIPFIKEFVNYKDNFNDSKILLVGNGEQEEQVKDLLKELNLEEYFILTGFQNDVYKFYPIIDIFFLPSLYEGLPMVILEAMAFKKPVVSMNVGSISEVVNQETGIIVNEGEYKNFINKLVEMKSDKTKAKVYGENAYNFINKNYNIHSYVKKIEEKYMDIKSKEKVS
ncbi:MAG: glycosyltransferase, partial [Sarcina sp.]